MQQSSDDDQINWQLLAIRALVKEGKTGQAVSCLTNYRNGTILSVARNTAGGKI
ncbi:hypothetical protein ACULNC_16860 [Shigella flexneri]